MAKSNAVGVAEVKGTTATIELLDGILTLEGQTTYSGAAAAKLNGCLVTVSSYKRDYLTLSKVNGKGASTALNLDHQPHGALMSSPPAPASLSR